MQVASIIPVTHVQVTFITTIWFLTMTALMIKLISMRQWVPVLLDTIVAIHPLLPILILVVYLMHSFLKTARKVVPLIPMVVQHLPMIVGTIPTGVLLFSQQLLSGCSIGYTLTVVIAQIGHNHFNNLLKGVDTVLLITIQLVSIYLLISFYRNQIGSIN